MWRRTRLSTLIFSLVAFLFGGMACGQVLFTEECFTGGVMAVGINKDGGSATYTVPYHWEDHYTFRKAYVVTYRYGRPAPHATRINGMDVPWGPQNQVSPELPHANPWSTWFAAHVQPLDSIPDIASGALTLDFPPQQFYDFAWNWGWSSMYVVILYDSPQITKPVCARLYIANQRQDMPQHYSFDVIGLSMESPIALSLFTSRLTGFHEDRSRININNQQVDEIWGQEMLFTNGTQGHFYYENSISYGMNNDTANMSFHHYDGLAVINNSINNQPNSSQSLYLHRVNPGTLGGANLHPAFTLAYTPSCAVVENDVERSYSICPRVSDPRGGADRADSLTLAATPDYDRYDWTPGDAMNDSTVANPVLSPDTSGWYRVRMWDDDGAKCPQTIPVFVEVGEVPRPKNLAVVPSACPQNTGSITATGTPGQTPLTYSLDGQSQNHGQFTQLAPGDYHLAVTTDLGCTWDTTLSIELDPIQTAAFTPDPLTGYSPLEVFFQNESTGATSYQWLVDGVPIRDNEHFRYTFADSGSYEVMLLAFYGDSGCADTARYTLVVAPGIDIALPNVISPNGDGRNDALVARLAGVAHIRWEVFGRWGHRLFGGEAASPGPSLELWRPAPSDYPEGVYTLALTARGHNGQNLNKVVQVTVVR